MVSGTGGWSTTGVAEGKAHGKGVIARLEGCEDRDAAMRLLDREIAVNRDQLPEPEQGEYYWHDLQGMQVINQQGERLGEVESLLETGANDVLVVRGERERLIPFVSGPVIISVDRDAGEIRVDWDKDF